MDFFLGIEDMPIYNFDKVLKSGNLSYMVVGWNERKELNLTQDQEKKLNNQWGVIYNVYCERTANNEALNYYQIVSEVSYLEMRYSSIISLVECLCEAYKKEIGLRLNKWGIPFNIEGSIDKQLPQLQRQLRIAKQNLKLKTRKMNSLKGDDDEEKTSVLAQYLRIEKITGIKVDIRKDSVEKGIELHELAKETISQQKAANGR